MLSLTMQISIIFFFNDTATTEIYTLSLHDALPISPQNWSIGMYSTHIVANRAWWFHARMGEGSADLTSLELWALGICEGNVDPFHPATKLVAGLEKTWQMIEQTLARLTPADLFEVCPPLDQAERVRH